MCSKKKGGVSSKKRGVCVQMKKGKVCVEPKKEGRVF